MLTIVSPGQGAQTPGFLSPWLEVPGFADGLAALGEAAGLDLIAHGTTSDAATITDTAVAQPLLVAAGLLVAEALAGQAAQPLSVADVVAGHSVGEITAAAGVGVLTRREAMRFVALRGRGMAAASAATPTTMAAVIGGDHDEVLAAIEAAGLTAANHNGVGQIVAAGTVERMAKLEANPPARARVRRLAVAGAFHTAHMAPALTGLATLATSLAPVDPATTLLGNADGQPITSGADVVASLVAQVTRPVRWDACMATMSRLGVTGLLELAPAGTLTGLAKRNLPDVERFRLDAPDQLDDARAFVAAHAGRRA